MKFPTAATKRLRYDALIVAPWLLLAAASAHADDLLVVTASDAVLGALSAAIDLEPAEDLPGARVFSARVSGPSGRESSLHVVALERLDTNAREVTETLVRTHAPRVVALVDTGMALTETDALGTVYAARSIWAFGSVDGEVVTDRAALFRCDLGFVSAASTAALSAETARAFAIGTGALAAGPLPEGDGGLITELLRLNGRTRVVVPGASEIARAIEQARAVGTVVGLTTLIGVAAGSVTGLRDEALAAQNAVAVFVDLL